MAAAASPPGFVEEQDWNPVGHTTRIYVEFQFPCSRRRFDFEKSFTFRCPERPTSWSLRLVLQREPGGRAIDCDVTIHRLDSTPVAMGTELKMIANPSYPPGVYISPNFRAEGLLPNHQRRSLFYFMPNEALNQPGDSPVEIQMTFRIRHCHGNFAGPVRAFYLEQFPPPTDSEEMFVNIPSQRP